MACSLFLKRIANPAGKIRKARNRLEIVEFKGPMELPNQFDRFRYLFDEFHIEAIHICRCYYILRMYIHM